MKTSSSLYHYPRMKHYADTDQGYYPCDHPMQLHCQDDVDWTTCCSCCKCFANSWDIISSQTWRYCVILGQSSPKEGLACNCYCWSQPKEIDPWLQATLIWKLRFTTIGYHVTCAYKIMEWHPHAYFFKV